MQPPLVAADDQALLGLLRGLGNPHRFRVFRALCGRPLRGKEVSAACGVTPQEASRHLARLTALGLAERRGRTVGASDRGLRLAALLDEVAAVQAAKDRLVGFDLAALPPDLPLAPLLAAGPRDDPEGRLLAGAERAALHAQDEVLWVAPGPWPAWPADARGPTCFAALVSREAAEAAAFPPLPAKTVAQVGTLDHAPFLLVLADRRATLVLPRAGDLAVAQPFDGEDASWVAWCRRLYEHHARTATGPVPARREAVGLPPAVR